MMNDTNRDTHTDTLTDAERQERQRINAEMARWYGLSILRCTEDDCECRGEWNRWEK